jgi:hypothetical protein
MFGGMRDYSEVWLAFVHIKPEEGFAFKDLVDFEGKEAKDFIGAWANVLVRAPSIKEVIGIVPIGFKEKNFEVIFIESVQHLSPLVERQEVDQNLIDEADWLMNSEFVFLISNKLFPYDSES